MFFFGMQSSYKKVCTQICNRSSNSGKLSMTVPLPLLYGKVRTEKLREISSVWENDLSSPSSSFLALHFRSYLHSTRVCPFFSIACCISPIHILADPRQTHGRMGKKEGLTECIIHGIVYNSTGRGAADGSLLFSPPGIQCMRGKGLRV